MLARRTLGTGLRRLGGLARDAALLFVRVRSRIDFNMFLVRQRVAYYLGLLGLPLGVLAFFTSPANTLAVSLVGAALSLVTVVLARLQRSNDRRRFFLRPVPSELLVAEVAVGPDVELVTCRSGSAVVWPAVDASLATGGSPSCSWCQERYRLPPALAEVAFDLLLPQFRRPSHPVYNASVIRQVNDLDGCTVARGGSVVLGRAKYFDLLCSNYVVGSDVRSGGDRPHLEGRSLMVDSHGRLRRLAENDLANVIGVSTLALTEDGRVVLVRQGPAALSSPGQLAPSGSGSLDLRDVGRLRRTRAEGSLTEVLVRGMARELSEEVNLRAHESGRTVVLGYFRWLDRGGKPEYVGVTLLPLTARAVQQRGIRRVERDWVRDVVVPEYEALDLDALRRDPDVAALSVTSQLVGPREVASLPLVMCLRALGHALNAAGNAAQDSVPALLMGRLDRERSGRPGDDV